MHYLLIALFLASLHGAEPVRYESKNLDFDETTGLLNLSGGFKILKTTQTLSGDRAIFDVNTSTGEAWDNLRYVDDNVEIEGSHLLLDATKDYFQWRGKTRGRFPKTLWHFQARQLDGWPHFYKAKRVRVTSCDRKHPHYSLWAWKGKIYPGDRASFEHAIFHLGPLPLLYFPYYGKNLSNEPQTVLYLNPGTNGREGPFLRSIWATPFPAQKLYLRTHVDWLKKLGLGFGPEILWRESEARKGSIYLYTINETNGIRRWDARGDGVAQVTKNLNLQGSFRYMQDPNFNNLYFRENLERVTPEVKSSMAANWNFSRGLARVYYSDRLNFDLTDKVFRSMDLIKPGFDFTFFPTPVKGGFLYIQGNIAANGHSTRSLASEFKAYQRWEESANVRVSQPWKIPIIPLGGEVGLFTGTNFVTKTTPTNFENVKNSNYGSELTTNLRDILGLDFLFSHRYALRSEKNSLRQDTTALDNGVDQNRLVGLLIGNLPGNLYLMARSAYDFRYIKNADPLKKSQRTEPIWGSLTIPFGLMGAVNWTTNYQLYDKRFAHNVSYSVGRENLMLNVSGFYENSHPNVLIPSVRGSVQVPYLNTYVTFNLRGEYLSRGETLSFKRERLLMFDREIVINPQLHDFLLAITLRARKDVREMFVAFRFKLSEDANEKFKQYLQEKEFYPWRE